MLGKSNLIRTLQIASTKSLSKKKLLKRKRNNFGRRIVSRK
jgi:hypothetical protein